MVGSDIPLTLDDKKSRQQSICFYPVNLPENDDVFS